MLKVLVPKRGRRTLYTSIKLQLLIFNMKS
jgi:hypothetical protein